MQQEIIKIGNSKGIRIPKAFIQDLGIMGKVDLQIREGQLVITPIRETRKGWEKMFNEPAEMLIPDTITSEWDDNEWEW
jgi:antitoxin MazE